MMINKEKSMVGKNRFFLLLLIMPLMAVQTALGNIGRTDTIGGRRMSFDESWRFHLGDIPEAKEASYNDHSWRSLNLPHDWSIEGNFNKNNPAGVAGGALPGGVGWYRKTFTIPTSDKNKLLFIDFDGIYMNSKVWINGHYLGNRPYGYSSFRYELTPYLYFGKKQNVIVVRVDNSKQPNSRWYSGSGIYRNVWLITTNKIHVAHWGTFVTTPKVNDKTATVSVNTSIRNALNDGGKITLTTLVYDPQGKEVAKAVNHGNISADSIATFSQLLTVAHPELWSTNQPVLYKVVTQVRSKDKLCDDYVTPFGIRYFRFDRRKGFFLDGKHLKIKGVCDHHDLGCLGAAINTRAIQRQLEILKGMGCNAVRTSHNPPAPELLQLCDQMGFLVMDEAFDCWKKGKNPYDYHLYWDRWHKRDLSDMICRDRNHPSIIIWSIGNEIPDQWDSLGGPIANELRGIVRSLDTTRPITSALNNPESKNNSISHSGALDLIGYNYGVNNYKDFFKDFPEGKFIATETTSALQSRGEYDMPSDSVRIWPGEGKKMNEDFTCSSYDNCRAPWGSTHEEELTEARKDSFVSGMFVWSGFDYLGEPTPYKWPSRSSYFGIIDLAGFPKDVYYLYKSLWTDSTVLHIFPAWNSSDQSSEGWHRGDSVDIWAYYNHADSVELFLNGKPLGFSSKNDRQLHAMWRVAYEPGILRAVSIKDGKIIKTAIVRTSRAAAKILLSADRNNIKADGKDLSFITIKVVDKNGTIVPHADNLIHFSLNGPGFIAGTDNGNETDHEPFKGNYRKAFNGMALAVIQAKNLAGTITLTAKSDGLTSATIVIHSRR